MCSLDTFSSCLTSFDSTKLFYCSMILFNFPCFLCQVFPFFFLHIQYICSPVIRVSVLGNYPKYLDKAIFFKSTIIPSGGIVNNSIATLPVLSGLTNLFFFNLVNQCHPFFLISLRFFMLEYHVSRSQNSKLRLIISNLG